MASDSGFIHLEKKEEKQHSNEYYYHCDEYTEKEKNIKLSKIYKYSTKIKINVLKLNVKKKVIHNRLTILATP